MKCLRFLHRGMGKLPHYCLTPTKDPFTLVFIRVHSWFNRGVYGKESEDQKERGSDYA